MDQTELDELAQLLQDGTNPERATILAQKYADWQANLAKQEAQACIADVQACATIADVQAYLAAVVQGKSDKFKQHVTSLCLSRITALLGAL